MKFVGQNFKYMIFVLFLITYIFLKKTTNYYLCSTQRPSFVGILVVMKWPLSVSRCYGTD